MYNYSDLWNEVLDKLELEFEYDIFNEVFKPCSFCMYKNNLIYILTPTDFIKSKINRLYIHRVNDILAKLVKDEVIKAKFIIENEVPRENTISTPEPDLDKKYRNNLNANYNFDNYVVGQSNMFAFRMAMKIADQPGEVANPFYIFGSVGLGKTHLMQAIGNYILDNDVKKKIL